MTTIEPVRIKPIEVRAMVLNALRKHNYTGKTTEIAEWVGLHASVVRRAGLTLANEDKLEAALVPGRGKGEYRFTITQLDLFEDGKKPKGSFPSLRQILDELTQVKTKLFLMNLFTRLRGK
jgi:DNA-binding IclR family transcriptional regulator